MTTLSSSPNKLHNMSSQRMKKSGELDVFEAAKYFSNVNEHQTRPARMSLDMPTTRPSVPPHTRSSINDHEKMYEKNNSSHKKYKQPSSPGGKLASFLNSIFNQTALKKKKQKTKDVDEESHTGRRKRKSSISHFRITSFKSNAVADDDCKSSISSVSGFRTPPTYANTPIKSYKEFRSFADHKKVVSVTNCNGGDFGKPKTRMELDSLVEEFKGRSGLSEKISVGFEGFQTLSHVDDGMDSDSSSDLFDLPNHDLDFYPTGLPVYETTHMDRIKIGTRIPTIFQYHH